MPYLLLSLIFSTSFVVGLSGALAPGPLLALTISEAAKRGFWTGPLLVLGHGLAEVGLVMVLALGWGWWLKKGAIATIIGMAGGLFLIIMGLSLVKGGLKGMKWEGERLGWVRGAPILGGALVSVANPYWWLWWATVGLSYVIWSLGIGLLGLSVFFIAHILSDLSWYSVVAFGIASGRGIIKEKIYKWLVPFCGLFLILLGGYFILSAIKGLW